MIFALFVNIEGSKSKAEAFMRDNWPMIRRSLRDRYPGYHGLKTNKGYMRRQRYDDYKQRHELFGDRLDQEFEDWAAEEAKGVGIGNPKARGTATNPARCNIVTGDGTVVKSPYGHLKGQTGTRRNGEPYIPAFDPDAARHGTGAGDQDGTKWVGLAGHTGEENGLMILGLRPQRSDSGGELAVGVAMSRDVKRRIPGLQAIAWDMAARGVHMIEWYRLGLLPFVKVHGKKNRTPYYLCTVEVKIEVKVNGTVEVQVHELRLFALADGSVAVKMPNQGRDVLVALETKQVHWRQTNSGISCFVESRVPDLPEVDDKFRNATVWWRPTDPGDEAKASRIAERVRIHGESSPVFQDAYWHRNTSEMANGWLKERLHQRRARSTGYDAQHLDMIGAAAYRNLQTVFMHRRRRSASEPPDLALAA
jgi:hypothetical protein